MNQKKLKPHLKGLRVAIPLNVSIKYEKYLLNLVNRISLIVKKELLYNSFFSQQFEGQIRLDDFNEDFEKVIKFIETKIVVELDNFLKRIVNIAILTDKVNQIAVEQSFNGLKKTVPNITNTIIRSEIKMWVSENVRLIKTIPEKMLTQVENIVYEATRTGVSYKELSKQLFESFDISRKRANIIARDQINKLNGNLTRARNLELGIKEYKWSTSKDERVRHSHEVLDGKTCSWEDSNVYKSVDNSESWLKRSSIKATLSHPSQDVLCRCSSIPIIEL